MRITTIWPSLKRELQIVLESDPQVKPPKLTAPRISDRELKPPRQREKAEGREAE